MNEVRARLAELREIGDDRQIGLDQVPVGATAAARTALEPARVLLGRGERHRQVGADPGQGIQRLLLRLIEAARDAGDHDHERNAEAEPECREDRASATANELVSQVAQIEHCSEKTTVPCGIPKRFDDASTRTRTRSARPRHRRTAPSRCPGTPRSDSPTGRPRACRGLLEERRTSQPSRRRAHMDR